MADTRNYKNSSGFEVFYDNGGPTEDAYHCHERHQIIFFLSGGGSYEIEGKTYCLRAGDLLLTSAQEIHRDSEVPEKRRERYFAYVDDDFFEEAKRLDANSEDLSRCFTLLSQGRVHLLRLEPAERKRIKTIFETLSRNDPPEVYGSDMLKKCYMVELLIHLNRACVSGIELLETEGPGRDVRQIVEFINENLTENLSLDLLSLRFGISKYHLTREFKRRVGLSLHQYILKKRLLTARASLRRGDTVSEAFAQSGFSDYSHFSRAFRECFGISPREYRAGNRDAASETKFW